VPEVPAHEKVFVEATFLSDPVHGAFPCTDCHAGDATAESREAAHAGLVPDPTSPGLEDRCGSCHAEIAADSAKSLHTTLRAFRHSVAVRAGTADLPPSLEQPYQRHCTRCHGSCGQCHVSSPAEAGGGLLDGHAFVRKPPANYTCTGCHGSRVLDEYKGLNPGIPADVHYQKGFKCTDCHSGDEMHGKGGGEALDRYQVPNSPLCEDCHPDDADFASIPAHAEHRNADQSSKLSCQACHAGTYKSCEGCHVKTDMNGLPVYEVNAPTHVSDLSFRIGRNPRKGARHPADWVTVRHAPAAPDTFDFYGEGLLPAFGKAPTWQMATPHTIQRKTPQNETCDGCHGHREWFLAPEDLEEYEVEANQGVVVQTPPEP
jgi:thiosulfate/3-mercaptopyruvate sulfurtransferase